MKRNYGISANHRLERRLFFQKMWTVGPFAVFPVFSTILTLGGHAQEVGKPREDFIGLNDLLMEDDDILSRIEETSLEDLLNPNVTSVSKKAEPYFDSAAAIHVISDDEIRRSGARSIPEALRMVPGMSVAQIDGNKWGVSSRGFNDRFSNKLLVLIDGRISFSPSFSGVMWDAQNYPLADIDRIEVVRGPGGTLWGANAVNGVINIITKGASKTQGTYIHGGAGTQERGFGGFRFGDSIGENAHFRVYGDFFERDGTIQSNDSYDNLQFGFQYEWQDLDQRLTFQGDYYQGNVGQVNNRVSFTPLPGTNPPSYIFQDVENFNVEGANLLLRYQRALDIDSDLQLQVYWDYTDRNEFVFDGYRNIFDVEFQHSFPIMESHGVVWGLGYRYMPDKFRNPDPLEIAWDPAETNHQLFSGFVQGEISLVEDVAKLIVGTKVEHNDYTGWEVQPNLRFQIKPSENQTIWGAVSRAVMVPLRNQEAITGTLLAQEPSLVPIGGGASLPLFLRGNGLKENGDLVDSEELLGFEIGYRVQPEDNLMVDVTAFYNRYDNLISGAPAEVYPGTTPVPHLNLPIYSNNLEEATTYGGEISVRWAINDTWRISTYYSHLEVDMNGSGSGIFTEGTDAKNQFSIQSSWDLTENLELDIWLRYVDDLPSFNIDSYFDLDVRLGWQVTENLELSLVGQNLLQSSRPEFGSNISNDIRPSEVERGAYLQGTLRF